MIIWSQSYTCREPDRWFIWFSRFYLCLLRKREMPKTKLHVNIYIFSCLHLHFRLYLKKNCKTKTKNITFLLVRKTIKNLKKNRKTPIKSTFYTIYIFSLRSLFLLRKFPTINISTLRQSNLHHHPNITSPHFCVNFMQFQSLIR